MSSFFMIDKMGNVPFLVMDIQQPCARQMGVFTTIMLPHLEIFGTAQLISMFTPIYNHGQVRHFLVQALMSDYDQIG